MAEEPEGPGWKLLVGVPKAGDVMPKAVLKAPVTSRGSLEAGGVTTGTLMGIVGKRPLELLTSEPVLLAPLLVLAPVGAEAVSVWVGVTDPVERVALSSEL